MVLLGLGVSWFVECWCGSVCFGDVLFWIMCGEYFECELVLVVGLCFGV